ncbi:HXXXD-TYPE ACYL-TRANSFERASE FAMILY PROTEIN [Salix koriyanagi]|uniref:HXXXD-TYPE ACYL-TRANSFERASE FAMILY PROTEIN n=1 Tax=Salix koriyanagi TaxID=2511006 RepID=A0A9Q0WJ95_9ROSI|nr:HXXXD-TYPE ACYL-TRANSFERASE FAMILY PROTEIN [Salix koriyanagi]
MANSVHVKEVIVIKPSEPTPSRVLSLSALDSQLFLRFTVEYLFVFKARPGLDQSVITARVKAALSKILVPYYPLAGRVRDQARWFKPGDVLKGAPPLVLQITWLRGGDATLGVGFNHSVCDGIGTAEFLNSFAELATGLNRVADLKPKPIWDRHLFDPTKSNRCYSAAHLGFNRVPDLCGFTSRFSNERLTPTSINVDKGWLNELKKLALSTSTPIGLTYTSYEVLSAHVWRSWARALNLPSNQILKLLFSINIRNRVKPSVPSGYYGNAFVLGCAQTTAKDLAEKGLGYATMLIKRAIESVDNEYVRSVIESVSQSRACPDSVGVLIMSQWSRLGLERVDFGMGKPVHVGPICSDRYCLILPVYNQPDAVKVTVAVPASVVDKYQYLVKSPCS